MGIIQSAVNQGIASVGALEAITQKRAKKKEEEKLKKDYETDLSKWKKETEGAIELVNQYAEYGDEESVNRIVDEYDKITKNFFNKYEKFRNIESVSEALSFKDYAEYQMERNSIMQDTKNRIQAQKDNKRNRLGGKKV